MKLATLPNGTRDGRLVVVSLDLRSCDDVASIATTLQIALERWPKVSPLLEEAYGHLNERSGGAPFDCEAALAPLPRAYQWLDGSAFKSHGVLMAKAFGRDPQPALESTVPLMYQGGSDSLLGAHADVPLPSEGDGIDFEAEIGVITGDVPMGIRADEAAATIRLFVLINDVSLRTIAPIEMATGFGWVQAKPSTAFAPVAVTPSEIAPWWQDGRLDREVHVEWNGTRFGSPSAREMAFGFPELIAHAAKTRSLSAGTIIGSGTVSNADHVRVGSACISERRAIEMIAHGRPSTPFMAFGDRVRIDVRDDAGVTIFGAIDQRMTRSRSAGALIGDGT